MLPAYFCHVPFMKMSTSCLLKSIIWYSLSILKVTFFKSNPFRFKETLISFNIKLKFQKKAQVSIIYMKNIVFLLPSKCYGVKPVIQPIRAKNKSSPFWRILCWKCQILSSLIENLLNIKTYTVIFGMQISHL
jgi:hypothetical protein